jgi:SAM-dependent methyltransferase
MEFGPRAKGVDWNDKDGQRHRFDQLFKILPSDICTVCDFGCGYGAMYDYIRETGVLNIAGYHGVDCSIEMIAMASDPTKFHVGDKPRPADYVLASGVFNVKLEAKEFLWEDYVMDTIRQMFKVARKGIAFNCLSEYCDHAKMRSDLYYADPCRLFDFCKHHLSRNVALLHDYDMYEFTMLVRKEQS